MLSEDVSLQVQCITYNLSLFSVRRMAEYVDRAASYAIKEGLVTNVNLQIGDCSPVSNISAAEIERLALDSSQLSGISQNYFSENLGHGGGQNKLLGQSVSDFTLILNPDILVAPNLLVEMIGAMRRSGAGIVEARQLPSEHPKDFDPNSGKTSWASGACLLISTNVLKDLGGFDAENFFLYCDDVDLSWRARLAGYSVVYQPTAVCFHDKRLTDDARWISGAAERYYSAEAGLLLPYKYSRPDLTAKYLKAFRSSGNPDQIKAADVFEQRKAASNLPVPIDPDHRVAQFVDGGYAPTRFHPR